MRVIVLGAGLVGLSTAHVLLREGVEVTVVDRAAQVGGGASRGNAGWVCPTQVAPLAAPGLVRRLTRDALSPSSALYIRPSGLLALTPFLMRLAAGATTASYRARVVALRSLAERAWPALEEAGIAVELQRTGILSVFSDEAQARHALGLLAPAREAGADVPDRLVDELGESCLSPRARAGYVLPGDGFVDPAELVEALAASVQDKGGRLVLGASVRAIRPGAVVVDGEELVTDAVVLAAGAATVGLAAMAGHRVRVVPGKGYSFTVEMKAPPSRPLHLEEAHVVLTPLPAGVRVAGTMELGDRTNRLDPRRVEAIAAAAAPWVEGVDWAGRTDVWVGERPLTTDGLPIIGKLADGLFVATGHGMYGVTLALPTGELLARQILGRADEPTPFAPR
jgi:D-amino-acid dehydrogenase